VHPPLFFRTSVPVVASVLSILSLPHVAHADTPADDRARSAFEEGVALEKRGLFAEALAKFKESELSKSTLGNRYHKAFCLERLGQLAAAMTEYESVERQARDSKKLELADATLTRLEPLRRTVPQLSIRIVGASPSQADVTLDGVSVAPSSLDGQPFRVDVGTHRVVARARGRQVFQRALELSPGAISTVDVVLLESNSDETSGEDAALNGDSAPVAAGSGERRSRRVLLPLVTTGGALALGVAGAAAFGLAGDAQQALRDQCSRGGSCEDGKTDVRTLDAVALGAFVGSAALATVSVVLWLSRPNATPVNVVARGNWLGIEGSLP
jgi:hypothetical protein